jgi:hypothetical protein
MRHWGFAPSPAELAAVKAAQDAFRDRWESIRPPFPVAFDGTIEEVHAIDYMDYESIEFPHPRLEISALVCGEVVRRAAGLEWVISYRGDWFIAPPEDSIASVAICPLARLHELECGGLPRSARHLWFVQKAALECLLECGPDREPMIRKLLEGRDYYLDHLQNSLERLQSPNRSAQHNTRKRRRAGRKKRDE